MQAPRKTDDMDTHIGQRIKLARQFRKLSQEELGAKTAVSFQMIQKYENGNNRVSASRLWKIAEVLNMPVTYFFVTAAQEHISEEKADDCACTVSERSLLGDWRKLPLNCQESITYLMGAVLRDLEEGRKCCD